MSKKSAEDREGNGRFKPGHAIKSPGRPKGAENQITRDIRLIHRDLITAWSEVGALERMIRIANSGPKGFMWFCEMVAKMLPKNVVEAGATQLMFVNQDIHNEHTINVAAMLHAQPGELTPDRVTDTLHRLRVEGKNGNGKHKSSNGK